LLSLNSIAIAGTSTSVDLRDQVVEVLYDLLELCVIVDLASTLRRKLLILGF
jgi:hypothetical protein